MDIQARYFDGDSALPVQATISLDNRSHSGLLAITDVGRGREVAHWPIAQVQQFSFQKHELRVGCETAKPGARLVITEQEDIRNFLNAVPELNAHRRRHNGKQFQTIAVATAALSCVIAAYIFGVPLFARQIVSAIPIEAEVAFGKRVVTQVENALGGGGPLQDCDTNSRSVANLAIERFSQDVLEQSGSSFPVTVSVVQSEIPNAFALPGGQVYYFSALLELTNSPDEFASVLAHEIGHVVNRHGMEQLVSSSGTGLLVSFILGDATGLSAGAIVGAALIDTRFSRDAELEADAFSLLASQSINYDAAALPNLLDRLGGDDEAMAAFALLSTHPMNDERRERLQHDIEHSASILPAFSQDEWRAIKTMCGASFAPSKQK